MEGKSKVVILLKNLMKRFDLLQKEVKTLKKKEAHWSMSETEVESSAERARSAKAALSGKGGLSAMEEQ